MKDQVPIIAALIVVIPLSLVIYFGLNGMSQLNADAQNPNMNDHLLLLKLENQTDAQNKTLTNVANFLQTQQIPFDNIISKQVQNLTAKH